MSYNYPPQQQFPQYQPPPPPPPTRRRRLRPTKVGLIVGGIFGSVFAVVAIVAVATANPGVHGITPPRAAASSDQPKAPSAAAPASGGPDQLTVGQTETVDNNSIVADSAGITITSMSNTTQPADQFGSAPVNGYYVIANLSVTSAYNGFPISSLDFYVVINGNQYQEGNGNSYEAVSNISEISGPVNAGNTATGQLYFDLPSPHGELVYAPNYQGAPIAEWSF